jgi:hypothetical protein
VERTRWKPEPDSYKTIGMTGKTVAVEAAVLIVEVAVFLTASAEPYGPG